MPHYRPLPHQPPNLFDNRLCDAVNRGDVTATLELLRLGANPNQISSGGYGLLHEIAHGAPNDAIIAKILIQWGINVNQNSNGWSALHTAIHHMNTNLIIVLYENNADLDMYDVDGGQTPRDMMEDMIETPQDANNPIYWAINYILNGRFFTSGGGSGPPPVSCV
jgi:ankyrin repeat protein